jgi:uncharacterized lipoprotein YmbA
VKATYRLEVEVHHLVGKPGGNLSLQATWMLCPGQAGPALLLKKISLEKPVQGLDAEALVAAHSQIIGDLSREVALELGTFLGRSK